MKRERIRYYLQAALDLEEVYPIFKESYEKATGSAWSFEHFMNRARNWTFYPKDGDGQGFVAIRLQRSGMKKLVGAAGNPKQVLLGFRELMTEGGPIWGAVDDRLARQLQKAGFIRPPVFLVKRLVPTIPASVFGGAEFKVLNDGGIQFKYDELGGKEVVKYFVANEEYYREQVQQLKHRDDIPMKGAIITALNTIVTGAKLLPF